MVEPVAVTQPAEEAAAAENLPVKDSDLTSRVSGVALENEVPAGDKKYDRNEFNEKLATLPPEMQEQVRLFQQTVYKGADEKFQEAARMRQEAENLRQQGYSKEDVSRLLNDPTFVATVQQLNAEREQSIPPAESGLSSEAWSYLSAEEKSALKQSLAKANQADQKISHFIAQQEHQRQHDALKGRYKNYDPNAVNEIYNGLMTGKVQANLEHLWKALDYEAAIKRSYELGKRESAGEIHEKINASTPVGGLSVSQNYVPPKKDAKISGPDYFKQLALKRMKQMGITAFSKQ